MPEDNGATKVTTGTFTIAMTTDGLAISTTSPANASSYVSYRFPDYKSTAGVIEVDFTAPSGLGRGQNLRVGYSDGENGMQISTISGHVAPLENQTPSATLTANQINTIRVSLRPNKFWLNGVLIGEVDYYTQFSIDTLVMIQNTYSKTITLRAIRIRRESP